jgi:hypothetical protein
MNVEIGAEAALFPEKEYVSGILLAVYGRNCDSVRNSVEYMNCVYKKGTSSAYIFII